MGKVKKRVSVGDCISVYWGGDRRWYYGQVVSYNEARKKCEVLYDDGEREMVNLRAEKYEIHEKQSGCAYVQDGAAETKRWKTLKSAILELVEKLRQSEGHPRADFWESWEAKMHKAFLSRNIVITSSLIIELARRICHNAATPWWISQKMAWVEEIREAKKSSELLSSVEKFSTQAVDWATVGSLLQPYIQDIDCLEESTFKTETFVKATPLNQREEPMALFSAISRISSLDGEDIEDDPQSEIQSISPAKLASSLAATLVCSQNLQSQLVPTMDAPLLDETFLDGGFFDDEEKEGHEVVRLLKKCSLLVEPSNVGECRITVPDRPVHHVFSSSWAVLPEHMKGQDTSSQSLTSAANEPKTSQVGIRQMIKGHQSTESQMCSAKEQSSTSQVDIGESFVEVTQTQQKKDQVQSSESCMYSAKELGTSLVETGDSFADTEQELETEDQIQSLYCEAPSLKAQGSLVEMRESSANNQGFSQNHLKDSQMSEGVSADSKHSHKMKDFDQSSQHSTLSSKGRISFAEVGESLADIAEVQLIKDNVYPMKSNDSFCNVPISQPEQPELLDYAVHTRLKMDHNESRQDLLSQPETREVFDSILDSLMQAPQMKDEDQSRSSHTCLEGPSSNVVRAQKVSYEAQSVLSQRLSPKEASPIEVRESESVIQGELMIDKDGTMQDLTTRSETKNMVHESLREPLVEDVKRSGPGPTLREEVVPNVAQEGHPRDQAQILQDGIVSQKEQGFQLDLEVEFVSVAQAPKQDDEESQHNQGLQLEIRKLLDDTVSAQQVKDQDHSGGSRGFDSETGEPFGDITPPFETRNYNHSRDCRPSSCQSLDDVKEAALSLPSRTFLNEQQCTEVEIGQPPATLSQGQQRNVGSRCILDPEQISQSEAELCCRKEGTLVDESDDVELGVDNGTMSEGEGGLSVFFRQNPQIEFMKAKYPQDDDYKEVYAQLQKVEHESKARRPSRTSQYSIRNGFLYFKERLCILKDDGFRSSLMKQCHTSAGSKHLGMRPTLRKLKTTCFWPKCRQDVENYVRSCCACHKAQVRRKNANPLSRFGPNRSPTSTEKQKDRSCLEEIASQIEERKPPEHVVQVGLIAGFKIDAGEPFDDIVSATKTSDQNMSIDAHSQSPKSTDIEKVQLMKDQAQSMKNHSLSDTQQCPQFDKGELFADHSQRQQRYDANQSQHTVLGQKGNSQMEVEFSNKEESLLPNRNTHPGIALANDVIESNFEGRLSANLERDLIFSMKAKYAHDDDFKETFNRIQEDKHGSQGQPSPLLARFSIRNGFLYFKNRLCIINNERLRNSLIDKCHTSAGSKHLNFKLTRLAFIAKFYWPNFRVSLQRHFRSCKVCHKVKKSRGEKEHPLLAVVSNSIFMPAATPWEKVITKIVSRIPVSSQGYDCVFVVLDAMSKQAHFIPCKESFSAEEIAQLYLREVVRYHGFPRSVLTDDTAIFKSDYWRSLWEGFGASVELDYPDFEKDNESMALEDFVKSYVSLQQYHWEESLHLFEFMYNNSVFHSSLKISPFRTLYGHDLFLPSPSLSSIELSDMSELVANVIESLHGFESAFASSSRKTKNPAIISEGLQVLPVGKEKFSKRKSEPSPAVYPNTRKRKIVDTSH